RSIFMKTDDLQPDPWMLEDVQLQCDLAAGRAAEALAIGRELTQSLSVLRRSDFERSLAELHEWRRRTLSYAYHLRETNLATTMRTQRAEGREIPQRMRDEMLAVLRADQNNQGTEDLCGPAITLLCADVDAFLDRYFVSPANLHAEPAPEFWTLNPDVAKVPDPWARRGAFTITSR
ncbi:MAG: hypothetical protein JWM57_123, partial [Phycisphaerales bacterium]|nr:hypothetical protein [Phycisphaerales bacterium]